MRFYYVELTILFNFHVSHWEKYNTGVLYLPWGYDLGELLSLFDFMSVLMEFQF